MILETQQGFQHISDVMSLNAILTMVFFVIALISLKIVATVAAAMVRDDARDLEIYKLHHEGKE